MKKITIISIFIFLFAGTANAAGSIDTLTVDYAYYSPVSLVVKDQRLIEQAFAEDDININWVLSLGSNRALEYLNSGEVQFGSTAGLSAVLARANGATIKTVYIYSRPEWTALVVPKDSDIQSVADLEGKTIAATKGTDPYLFLLRALKTEGLSKRDVKIVNLQHPDGRTALLRGDVDAWAGLDPHMAAAELQNGARLIYRNKGFNTLGVLNVNESFLDNHPEIVRRVIKAYEQGRAWAIAHPEQTAKLLADAANLSTDVASRQLRKRTDLTQPLPTQSDIDMLSAAAPILEREGLVRPGADVEDAIANLIDTQFAASVIDTEASGHAQ